MQKFFDNTLTVTSSVIGILTDTVQEIGIAKFFFGFSIVVFSTAIVFAY